MSMYITIQEKANYLAYVKGDFKNVKAPKTLEQKAYYDVINDMLNMLNINSSVEAFDVLANLFNEYTDLTK